MGRIILPFSTFYYICNEMVLAIPPLRDLVQQHLYVMRKSAVTVRMSHIRTPPNFLIWLLLQNLKTKTKNLAPWEL